MAKASSVERNKKRINLEKKYAGKRAELKAQIKDRSLPLEERFQMAMDLATLPRNSAKVRQRNRCEVTGRPRGVYRKFRMSRISLRKLASEGKIPGIIKSSW